MDRYYFNKVFKEERLKKNMSQTVFGKKLGVTYPTISLIERNKYTPTMRMIIRFCKVFNYNIEFVPLASPSL
jgi:DNA-binding XRE family transcriptional regulator